MYDEKIRPVMMVLLIAVLASSLTAAAEIQAAYSFFGNTGTSASYSTETDQGAAAMKLKIRTPHPGLKQIPPGKGHGRDCR